MWSGSVSLCCEARNSAYNRLSGLGGVVHLGYEKVAQAVRLIDELPIFRIPWGQNMILMAKVKDVKQRLWYAQQTIENGWSRNTLEMWIDSDLFSRQGKALTNFKATLPEPDSDLAEQSMKDPFCFDFLELTKKAKEVDIED